MIVFLWGKWELGLVRELLKRAGAAALTRISMGWLVCLLAIGNSMY